MRRFKSLFPSYFSHIVSTFSQIRVFLILNQKKIKLEWLFLFVRRLVGVGAKIRTEFLMTRRKSQFFTSALYFLKIKIYPRENLNGFFHKDSTQFFFSCAVILLSYLALAGAAMSMDLPLVFNLTIISLMYYTNVYVLLYIFIQYSIYDHTIELIKKEKDLIDFFQKVCYIFACFCYFIYSYKYFHTLPDNVVEESKKDLVNPLQVVAQLSCFFFYYKYKRSDVRERQLLLLCFVFCVISTLYIIKVKHLFVCFMISIFCFVVYNRNIDYVPLAVLLFYTLDDGLAKWGFFLLFQQFVFYALSISLDKEQTVPPKKKGNFFFLFFPLYSIIYWAIFLSRFLSKRTKKPSCPLVGGQHCVYMFKKKEKSSISTFFIYFIISIFIGFASLQGTLDLNGFYIVVIGHILFLWGLLLFIFSSERQGVVPFLFYTLFYILPYFPHIQWMEKWIEGFDLLLFFLSLFSFIEESRTSHDRIKKRAHNRIKKRVQRPRKSFKKRHKYSTGIRDPPG